MTEVVRLPPLRAGPFATPRMAKNGRYLIHNPAKAIAMRAMDAGLSLIPQRRPPLPARPARILLANWAHLGDLTATLGAVRLVRECFAEAQIGYLASSWGKAAAIQSGLVDTIHVVDHPRMNRTATAKTAKVARYRESLARATQEIIEANYEVAIDFYAYSPPAHRLFRRWGIPVRVGFDTAGWGPLLTHPVRWRHRERPISEHYDDLLEAIWPGLIPSPDALRPRLNAEQIAPLPTLLGKAPYLVLHPGAGAEFKDWGQARWPVLLDDLTRHARFGRLRIVLTGAGDAEIAYTSALAAGRIGVTNMAGRANWAEFVAIVAGAEAVICPDTVTGHIAAEAGTPVVSLFTGTNNAYHWSPNAERGCVLIEDVACAPCYRVGCETMACIRDIPPGAVIDALEKVLA